MPKVALYNQNGATVGEIELNDSVFGIEPNKHVLFEAVIMQRASLRQGTHKTKNRAEVSGGGRKPWRQKGTGRARQGSIRSPQWRGGGTVFGPVPRSYSYKSPKIASTASFTSVLFAFTSTSNVYFFSATKFIEFSVITGRLIISRGSFIMQAPPLLFPRQLL